MLPTILNVIFFQIIQVNSTVPCFLNQTAGVQIFQNCMGKDYLQGIILPFQWILGGYFSMAVVAILILITYFHYHKTLYTVLIGIIFLPVSYYVFPTQFIIFGLLFAVIGIGILGWWIHTSQTQET